MSKKEKVVIGVGAVAAIGLLWYLNKNKTATAPATVAQKTIPAPSTVTTITSEVAAGAGIVNSLSSIFSSSGSQSDNTPASNDISDNEFTTSDNFSLAGVNRNEKRFLY